MNLYIVHIVIQVLPRGNPFILKTEMGKIILIIYEWIDTHILYIYTYSYVRAGITDF